MKIDFDEAESRANIDSEISRQCVQRIKSQMKRERRTKPTPREQRILNRELRNYDLATDRANSYATKNDMRHAMNRRSEQTSEQYHFHKECAQSFRLQRLKLILLRKEKKAVKQIDKLLHEEDKGDDDYDFNSRIEEYSSQCTSALGDRDIMTSKSSKDYIRQHELMLDEEEEEEDIPFMPAPPSSSLTSSSRAPSPLSETLLQKFTDFSLCRTNSTPASKQGKHSQS